MNSIPLEPPLEIAVPLLPAHSPARPARLPDFSIVTPSLNRAAFLPFALASVAEQPGAIEHILVDGGSTDATEAVLAAHPWIRLIPGPDRNSHDAMNKGLAQASGEFIGFLNSDDRYEAGLLEAVAKAFRSHPDADAVVARAGFCRAQAGGRWMLDHDIRHFPAPPGLWLQLTFGIPAFNSWFFRRRVFERLGNFNADYLIAADRDFLLRFAAAGLRAIALAEKRYLYLVHDRSATLSGSEENTRAQLQEHLAIARTFGAGAGMLRRIVKAWAAFELLQLERLTPGAVARGRSETALQLIGRRLRMGEPRRLFREAEAKCWRSLFSTLVRQD